jgi:hypothetical protein
MPLPAAAVASLAEDMPSKGFGAPKSSPTPDATSADDGEASVLSEIAGDVVDAIQSGSKEEASKFLVELVQRVAGGNSGAAAAMPGDEG